MLCDFSLSIETVIKEIDKIRKAKSPGPDDIYQHILKEGKDILSETLASISKKTSDTCIVLLV